MCGLLDDIANSILVPLLVVVVVVVDAVLFPGVVINNTIAAITPNSSITTNAIRITLKHELLLNEDPVFVRLMKKTTIVWSFDQLMY